MERVITYSLQEDFIQSLAGFVEDNFIKKGRDISRLALVFGGKRPSLFLKRELSRRFKKGFYPPAFFSIDEFMERIVSSNETFTKLTDLDGAYFIYNLAKDIAPEILRGREEFSQFLPWAREIAFFIEQLDLEAIPDESAERIQLSASIGYEIPKGINEALKNIIALRKRYHKELKERKSYSRGLTYLLASQRVKDVEFKEFDTILFCGLFYFQKTDEVVIKNIYERGKATLIFQGDDREWPVLKNVAQSFSCSIQPQEVQKPRYNLEIEAGFDVHSQVCLVREALKKVKNHGKTVVVLPNPGNVIPLLAEVASAADDFNVSMGYPLKRSSLYNLFEDIFKAQDTRKDSKYYTKDYLKVISHPFVKNLRILSGPSTTRVVVHKIEEILLGIEKTPLGGSLFVDLEDIRGLDELYMFSERTLKNMGIKIDKAEFPRIVDELHDILFYSWEKIGNFHEFSGSLDKFLDVLVRKSSLSRYPLDLEIMEKMFGIREELKNAEFKKEPFLKEDIFRIFENKLQNERISFSGSPLKGLQVLGLFETRSLNFENVIFMDVNESVLPKLRIYEPLIPREVMLGLGINSLERDEEIQRYQFRRLISCARNVHLVYEDNAKKGERSRFIEEIIWSRQKDSKALDVLPLPRASYKTETRRDKAKIQKTPDVIGFLNDFQYSASSINTYVQCPLRFYYQYVLGIREKEEIIEDLEGSHIGTFIHELLEETFKRFKGKKPRIDEEFEKYFKKTLDGKLESDFKKRMKSDFSTLRKIMRFRLDKFLGNEKKREGVSEILCLEDDFKGEINIGGRSIKLTSKIDRIDRLENGSLLILDYKTGGEDPMPRRAGKMETMDLSRESIKHTVKSFQLPIYIYLAKKHHKAGRFNAALYYLRTADIKYFLKKEDIERDEEIVDIFMKALKVIISEILDPKSDFEADDENVHFCENCSYCHLCR